MWVEIILVSLVRAALVHTYELDDEDTYHNYKINDDVQMDLLGDLGLRPRDPGPLEARQNATMAPEDVAIVKGAIQRLLGNLDIPDYVGATSPTRSPAPPAPPAAPELRAGEPAPTVLPGQPAEQAGADEPAAPPAAEPTRSSYTQLLGQLMEYADSVQKTKTPPARTSDGQLRVPPRPMAAGRAALRAPPTARLRPPRKRGRGGRPRSTLPPWYSTRNTLCTHDARVCATMCFDEEKYRISCPPTTASITSPRVDVSRLLAILSSLVMDYDTNITLKFRKKLRQHGYLQCARVPPTARPTTTTTTEAPWVYDYEVSNRTGALISKCFVCGLEDDAIPMNAHCSDAFAGEFLPMTPVDASARGYLHTYRKYCRYMDMRQWYVNGSDSRTMWGRWTGGCSVRWVDISGVYTQRSCRNRFQPIMGHHFVSKRMARLEKALRNVDNGCIISPMASLVPFSRGVSLFARFHACVCTGNWCNRVVRVESGDWLLIMQTLLLTITYLS